MPPPILGTSRWATTAPSDEPSWTRIWSCRQAGNTSMMRSIAWEESLVCRVEKTRWPVSASVRASWMDSRSRISPTSRTSGSSRRAERRARSKEGLSVPTSRWVIGREPVLVHVLDGVLDREDVQRPGLVDPVDDGGERGRLTRTRSGRSGARGRGGAGPSTPPRAAGRARRSVGMSEGIMRRARAVSPFWVNALPRRRARSRQVSEKSTSCCSSNVASCSGLSMPGRSRRSRRR